MCPKSPFLEWLFRIPKAELHIHLEGSLRPGLLRKLAAKHSIAMPPRVAEKNDDCEEPAYRYSNFLEFLDCLKTACSVIRSAEDLAEAADSLFDALIDENIRYAEIFISPVIHERNGISTLEAMKMIHALAMQKNQRQGFICRFLFDAVRQWGEESCSFNVRLAEACMHLGVVGIGIGGDERSLPAEVFAGAFRDASAAGLHITAHAGEYAGPASVRDALQHLRPERIGHGIRAAEAPRLLEEIRQRGITLDVCLTSNLRTGVWSNDKEHPILKIHANKIPFTLNTDDPAVFNTTLRQELFQGSSLLSFGTAEIEQLMLSTLKSSFLAERDRAQTIAFFRGEFDRMAVSCD